jgi:uncharacterized protein YraI
VQIVITSAIGAFVRRGPGTTYEVIGEVEANQTFSALAYTTTDDIWYLIDFEGTPAWISGWVAGPDQGADVTQIALALTIPPSPTPSPTLTPLPATATPTLIPGANAWIESDGDVNLRGGPSTLYDILSRLAPRLPLMLTARNTDATWYQIMTFDGRAGWVSAEYVSLYGVNGAGLPIIEPTPVVITSPGSNVVSAAVLQQARTIYQRGQQMGNAPNSFIVIGDSTSGGNTNTLPFFTAFAHGSYNLGNYGYLQSTIDFFRWSFGASFVTAQSGFVSSYVIDPTWANPTLCQAGETLLNCEIRLHKPSFAFVYIGIMDMLMGTPEAYATNLDAIVRALANSGVVPILTTITTSDAVVAAQGNAEKIAAINRAIRQTAATYQLPLIDFQQAAHNLPNQGCVEDGHHLSFRQDGVINFTGDEQIYGKDLRELLSLQMLHDLRVNLIG